MNYVKLIEGKLNVEEVNDLVAHESCGAISLFIGTTRDNFQDKLVESLEYEAYEPMALKTMTSICEEIRSKWSDVKNIAIFHRLGEVPIKEASVIIAISSPHRESSLASVSWAIDELKRQVPIWKKEKYSKPEGGKRLKLEPKEWISKGEISSHLVQITATEEEVENRIKNFIERKRKEVDVMNIKDFITNPNENDSCARIQSTVFRTINSKGHLKVHRVVNDTGPNDSYVNALDKLREMDNSIEINSEKNIPPGVEERLKNAEAFLKINQPIERTIYERLREIEDRILKLESISPEYSHFIKTEKIQKPIIEHRTKKKMYSLKDVDNILESI